MDTDTALGGGTFADEDIERWTEEHERGYEDEHLGEAQDGRPGF